MRHIENNATPTRRSPLRLSVSALLAALCALVVLCSCSSTGAADGTQGLNAGQALSRLDAAEKITLKKDMLSFGDHWSVSADGKKVADITGEFIKIWDCYVMRSTNGDFMCAEQEELSLFTSRAAKIDESGKEIGRYDQVFTLAFLNIEDVDADGKKTAQLKQRFSIALDCDVEDADGKVAYRASKALISAGAEITLTRVDAEAAKKVGAQDAVMMSVIANELEEAASARAGSSGK